MSPPLIGKFRSPVQPKPNISRTSNIQLPILRMLWNHEPRGGGRRRASVLDCGSPLPLLRPRTRAESARGLAHSKTWRYGGRFMERYDDLSFFLSPSLAGLCLDFAHDAEPNRFHHRHRHRGGQDGTGHGAHLLFAQSWPEGGGAQTNLLRRAGGRARSAEVARWRNDASGNQSMEFSRPPRAPPRRAAGTQTREGGRRGCLCAEGPT